MPDASSFLPANLDPADFSQLQPLYQQLLERPLDDAAAVRDFLQDYSDLSAIVGEYVSRRQIELSCHTDDAELEKRYLHVVENILPKIKPLATQLQRKLLACSCLDRLDDPKYAILIRDWKQEVELFRQENISLQTELTKLSSQYDKLAGAMTVEFQGQRQTLQQLARYQEEPDRTVRRQAWQTAEDRRRQDQNAIEALFDAMLDRRAKLAANADCSDYRQYVWKSYGRFDYTPQDCLTFADAIEEACMPLVDRLNQQRAAELGLDKLRPWDLAVDPRNRPALKPFDPQDIDGFVARTRDVFQRISPMLAEQFDRLKPNRNLDLQSRPGKRPGGYQASLEVVREPFIFMNAAGLQRDVETLLHEGGHAFHYLQSRNEPLVFLRQAPIEFCEVASMSMELLGDKHLDCYYPNSGDAQRARQVHLEGIIRFFPWMACIDLFQHWLYTHPGHSGDERRQAWLGIHQRFTSRWVDWSELQETRASLWQRQVHLFHYPFYYVEYGIAQLGALQVWQGYQRNPQAALKSLLGAFALGGTRRLPELFSAADIRFDFSAQTLKPLMALLDQQTQAG